jgi:hypothetical protein
MNSLHLRKDVALVVRQLVGQIHNLAVHDVADRDDQRQSHCDNNDDTGNARQADALKAICQRRKQEAQQHRQHQRDKHVAREVKPRDDHANRGQKDEA